MRAALEAAKNRPFREAYKIGPDNPYTLKDEDIALFTVTCMPRNGGQSHLAYQAASRDDCQGFREALPAFLHRHFDQCHADPRFDRFVLFIKGEKDGLIVGVGKDEIYYVIATWNKDVEDKWTPNPGEQNPLIAPARTIAR